MATGCWHASYAPSGTDSERQTDAGGCRRCSATGGRRSSCRWRRPGPCGATPPAATRVRTGAASTEGARAVRCGSVPRRSHPRAARARSAAGIAPVAAGGRFAPVAAGDRIDGHVDRVRGIGPDVGPRDRSAWARGRSGRTRGRSAWARRRSGRTAAWSSGGRRRRCVLPVNRRSPRSWKRWGVPREPLSIGDCASPGAGARVRSGAGRRRTVPDRDGCRSWRAASQPRCSRGDCSGLRRRRSTPRERARLRGRVARTGPPRGVDRAARAFPLRLPPSPRGHLFLRMRHPLITDPRNSDPRNTAESFRARASRIANRRRTPCPRPRSCGR